MAHIRLDDNEIELSTGELRIGTSDDAQVRLDAGPEKGILAIIIVDPSGTPTVRRSSAGATILVNGVALGPEPAPLLHGDRIEVAGRQLRFSDDHNAGSTVLMPALGTAAAPAPARRQERASGSGGRLVSLVDGREYAVPASGLRSGRDAASDVVVPDTEVSRHHADLSVTTSGYVLRDASANGVFINGARMGDAQVLRRGDVIRIGGEEFRFYADPVAARAAEVPDPPPAPTVAGVVSGEAPALATLEVVNEGAWKGTLYRIRALDAATAVRFGGVKVIFRSEPQIVDADGGTRVIIGIKPSPQPHQPRVPVARSKVATRTSDASDSARRRIAPLVWIAAAAAIGATVLFVIQDR